MRIFFKCFIISSLLLITGLESVVFAQEKSINDTIVPHSAKRATILSAIIPGAGQFYNKKYWKIPIIYGGLCAIVYSYVTNNKEYNNYLEAYKLYNDPNYSTSNSTAKTYRDLYNSSEILKSNTDYYRQNKELSLILGGLLHVINILDASVDAHLFNYDINDDLSIKLTPRIQHYQYDNYKGVTLTLNFK